MKTKNVWTKLSVTFLLSMILNFNTITVFSQNQIRYENWEILLEENFDAGTTISQLEQDWYFCRKSSNPACNYENCAYLESNDSHPLFIDPNNLDLSNPGYLYIHMIKDNNTYKGNDYEYSAGFLRSKYDEFPGSPPGSTAGMIYGMFEIRCKMPGEKGHRAAFWLSVN